MFETYGDEVKFIQEADDHSIWTYGDGDDGGTYIWSGYSFVNRIGYFLSDVKWVEGTDYQILVIPADDEDEVDNDEDEE
jgi:hypothetical protein